MNFTGWREAEINCALSTGIYPFPGWIKGSVGILRDSRAHDRWVVIHLETGHMIIGLRCFSEITAFEIATAIEACGDWASFISLDGYRNSEPDIWNRVYRITMRYKTYIDGTFGAMANAEHAREVARER